MKKNVGGKLLMSNESYNLFMRTIKERHAQCVALSDSLLKVFISENIEAKKRVALEMLGAANQLMSHLSSSDYPDWLSSIAHRLKQVVDSNINYYDFIVIFVELQRSMKLHKWNFDSDKSEPFDFDSIFEKYKKQSKIPDLFNEIIEILEQIKDSGEIDSLIMINSLNKVISTVKKCKDTSYFSLNSAWNFLLSFVKNYLWEELSKIPVLGAALEALGKTMTDLDNEMVDLNNSVNNEIVRVVESEMRFLDKKASFPFLCYNSSGNLLLPSSEGKSTSISV